MWVRTHVCVRSVCVRGAAHPPPYRHDATARGMLCEYMEHLEHLASAVLNLTSRAGELRSAPSGPDDRYRVTG